MATTATAGRTTSSAPVLTLSARPQNQICRSVVGTPTVRAAYMRGRTHCFAQPHGLPPPSSWKMIQTTKAMAAHMARDQRALVADSDCAREHISGALSTPLYTRRVCDPECVCVCVRACVWWCVCEGERERDSIVGDQRSGQLSLRRLADGARASCTHRRALWNCTQQASTRRVAR